MCVLFPETKAKVIDTFDEGDEEEDGVSLSALRKQATALLPETDSRYQGKTTSRKELLRDITGSGECRNAFFFLG